MQYRPCRHTLWQLCPRRDNLQGVWSTANTVSPKRPTFSQHGLYSPRVARQPGQPLRPREAPQEAHSTYPLTPSDSVNSVAAAVATHLHHINAGPRDSAIILASPTSTVSTEQNHQYHVANRTQTLQLTQHGRPKRSPDPEPTPKDLVPYYAGKCLGVTPPFQMNLANGLVSDTAQQERPKDSNFSLI